MTQSYTELMLDTRDDVATITFNRPEARNPLGGALRTSSPTLSCGLATWRATQSTRSC